MPKGNIPKDIKESADRSFGIPVTEAGRDAKNCYMAGMIDERANGKKAMIAELKNFVDNFGKFPNDLLAQLITERIAELEKEQKY